MVALARVWVVLVREGGEGGGGGMDRVVSLRKRKKNSEVMLMLT